MEEFLWVRLMKGVWDREVSGEEMMLKIRGTVEITHGQRSTHSVYESLL